MNVDMASTRSEDVIHYDNFESNSPLFKVRFLSTKFALCAPGETEEVTVPLNFVQVLFSTRGDRMFAPALYAAPRAFSSCPVCLSGHFENVGLNLDIAIFIMFPCKLLFFLHATDFSNCAQFKFEFNVHRRPVHTVCR